ncbi:hypothetical protein ACLOJK_010933 [Asimina triloba]
MLRGADGEKKRKKAKAAVREVIERKIPGGNDITSLHKTILLAEKQCDCLSSDKRTNMEAFFVLKQSFIHQEVLLDVWEYDLKIFIHNGKRYDVSELLSFQYDNKKLCCKKNPLDAKEFFVECGTLNDEMTLPNHLGQAVPEYVLGENCYADLIKAGLKKTLLLGHAWDWIMPIICTIFKQQFMSPHLPPHCLIYIVLCFAEEWLAFGIPLERTS